MNTRLLILLLTTLAFTACDNHNETRINPAAAVSDVGPGKYVKVTKVVDGDTFWADDGSGKDIKVRLIGVNTPESQKSARKDVEYFGAEAKDYLTALLTGRQVKLVSDVGLRDQYGRTLSYVYLRDTIFVNALLVREGYAQVMTIPPNVKHASEFVQLEREARENKRGMWKPMPM